MWLCRIELNTLVNSEEIYYLFQLVERLEFNRCCCCGLDWQGGTFYVILIVSKCLEVDTCTSSKLSICLKYLVTSIRFLLLFSD